MAKRELLVLGASPRHQAGKVTMPVVLRWLKGEPIEQVELTPVRAIELGERLIRAARLVIEVQE